MPKEHQGLIQVFTGNGKGKTTSSLGLGLRAIGQGFKVYIIQFLKSGDTGELFSIKKYLPNMTITQFGIQKLTERQLKIDQYEQKKPEEIEIKPTGPKGEYYYFAPDELEREACRRGLEHAKHIINSGEHEIVILDEINCALSKSLISIQETIKMLDEKPKHVEVLMTGRGAPKEIIDRADLVSEIKEIKHPFHKGILARRGIEY